jgi:hypothetical protein
MRFRSNPPPPLEGRIGIRSNMDQIRQHSRGEGLLYRTNTEPEQRQICHVQFRFQEEGLRHVIPVHVCHLQKYKYKFYKARYQINDWRFLENVNETRSPTTTGNTCLSLENLFSHSFLLLADAPCTLLRSSFNLNTQVGSKSTIFAGF